FIRILANVTDRTAVLNAIKENNIDIVFHAAAVKHVPLLEENIAAALKTNLLGTSVVADCCEKSEVKKMVFISTDKAVNPTSIMGATKRLAERIITERVYKSTAFVVVRFGNVLGSSGSVVPRFKKQIKDGGPVTVTSKNITRYFMSIPEAVNLVLQAGSIGKNGNIMVLQMGNSIKIYELAKKLIELSGFRPEIDIRIKFTGLRPGEKEYEELLTEKEKVNNTIYDKIFISKFVPHGNEPIDLDTVINLIKERNLKKIKIYLKKQIPEALFN
ncbi:MAG: polysaccharide biosynthesis protein, partial [Victivallales bacterium]|nr:polysaccharide biosynthesis protein [Victivallales bacterium]